MAFFVVVNSSLKQREGELGRVNFRKDLVSNREKGQYLTGAFPVNIRDFNIQKRNRNENVKENNI